MQIRYTTDRQKRQMTKIILHGNNITEQEKRKKTRKHTHRRT